MFMLRVIGYCWVEVIKYCLQIGLIVYCLVTRTLVVGQDCGREHAQMCGTRARVLHSTKTFALAANFSFFKKIVGVEMLSDLAILDALLLCSCC